MTIELTNRQWMPGNNVIGLGADVPLFRVFDYRRLIETVRTGSVALVPPELWDDPFENFLLRHRLFRNLHLRYYGQCWTLNEVESDALWRIYSPAKLGVRVSSSSSRLFDAFVDFRRESASAEYWMGAVDYWHEKDLRAFFEDPGNLEQSLTTKRLVQSFLIKRAEFSHEKEVRLIYAGHKDYCDITRPVVCFSCVPNTLFDECLFDPRYSDTDFASCADELRAAGFTGSIRRSELYRLPHLSLSLPGVS